MPSAKPKVSRRNIAPQRASQNPEHLKFSLDKSLAVSMRDLHRMFTRSLERRIAAYGITTNMWYYLRYLWENDGATPREISEYLGVKGPSTNQSLDELQGNGLIVRVRDTEDRRLVRLYLTPKGVRLKHSLLSHAVEVQNIALSNITAKEAQQFRDVLRRMKNALNGDQKEQSGRP